MSRRKTRARPGASPGERPPDRGGPRSALAKPTNGSRGPDRSPASRESARRDDRPRRNQNGHLTELVRQIGQTIREAQQSWSRTLRLCFITAVVVTLIKEVILAAVERLG
jgi:hypothetical protein